MRARRPDRDSGRPRAALRRADLPAGASAARCPSCGSSCSRCRIGSPTARRSRRRWRRCSGNAPSTLAAAPHAHGAGRARGAVDACGRTCRTAGDARSSRRRQRADSRSGARSRRLPAAHRRGEARRSRPEARSAEAETGEAQQPPPVIQLVGGSHSAASIGLGSHPADGDEQKFRRSEGQEGLSYASHGSR